MDIILLDYYLRIFAILANLFPHLLLENVKDFLKNTVLKELNYEIKLESLQLLNDYYHQYSNTSSESNFLTLWSTLSEIDKVIPKKQKFQILLRLLLFEKILLKYSLTFPEVTQDISLKLNIDLSEYLNCKGFISEKYYQIHDLEKLLVVSGSRSIQTDLPYMYRENFKGQLIFLYIEKHNTFLFSYKGIHPIIYNNQGVYASYIYFFNKGTSIIGQGFEPVSYNQVLRKFRIHEPIELSIEVRDLEFKYHNSNHGLHKLNLNLESEQLIGIIGRSGVGKSTLINLLIGNKQPTNGSISINGLDLKQDYQKLDGIIGYVSQDDLLVEELSVFMNMFINASLCFGNLSKEVLEEKVNKLLIGLDLYDVKDMQVGSSLNRLISGGQRKKLNIALELIHEPWILFADEPTSGLSSSDSEEIMQHLSELTATGKIVVVNIHQPSSDIFKMFDKIIVLDKEGYPVYFGSPLESISYFHDYYNKVALNADSCFVCENVNPEAIFKVLEEKITNEFGELTKVRKTSPLDWHKHFLKSTYINSPDILKKKLPKIHFSKPGSFKQFLIFFKRNALTKLTNYQYILLALLISPVLSVVLSLLCKYNNISENLSEYSFAYNENIPSYFFMSVIVALFLGLIMSAEEIIKDRKIVIRESFLRLNKLSYINSKVAFVFGISAIQSFLYVIIGNAILDIQGMALSFWLILFSTSFFANLLGLLISSVLNSVIAIYILVPMIIVPQMLLSGIVVEYDKINKYVSSQDCVPFVGDIMASRWAYEAMVTKQFIANDFQKHFIETEKQISNVKFNLLFVIPEIKKAIQNSAKNKGKYTPSDQRFLKNELAKLHKQYHQLGDITVKPSNLIPLNNRIESLNLQLSVELDKLTAIKDNITKSMVQKFGNVNHFLSFKNRNYNNSLADIVLKRKELDPYVIVDHKIVRKFEPVYQEPYSMIGRAHFLSASKNIGLKTIDTFVFNLIVLWLMSLITYIFIVFIFLKKTDIHLIKMSKFIIKHAH